MLLCTDGLTKFVSDDMIKNVLMSTLSLEKKANQLVDMANTAGGTDNITTLIVQVEEGDIL
ncbi:Protein-serine/threonine phosphatase [Pediococcus pentosaceus]|uniref:Protein-serine/threonine phosphatase n=1 Tax=Pediococcus pentosaceus TaxID=1255 RepID=A0A1Y0VTG7_PEDPE|nr:Protein-serine/threonine phosphatase [Pediococcus pentosaceus]